MDAHGGECRLRHSLNRLHRPGSRRVIQVSPEVFLRRLSAPMTSANELPPCDSATVDGVTVANFTQVDHDAMRTSVQAALWGLRVVSLSTRCTLIRAFAKRRPVRELESVSCDTAR